MIRTTPNPKPLVQLVEWRSNQRWNKDQQLKDLNSILINIWNWPSMKGPI